MTDDECTAWLAAAYDADTRPGRARCVHGRHQGDDCADCAPGTFPSPSTGFTDADRGKTVVLPSGATAEVVGYSLHGTHVWVRTASGSVAYRPAEEARWNTADLNFVPAAGMVIVETCTGAACRTDATTHHPGRQHQLTVRGIRPRARIVAAHVTDEDGHAQLYYARTSHQAAVLSDLAERPAGETEPVTTPATLAEQYGAQLRKSLRGNDDNRIAAAELLIQHGYWLGNQDFLTAAVETDMQGRVWVWWDQAREAFDRGEFAYASTTQLAVLDFAIELGRGRWKTDRLDTRNSQLVYEAMGKATEYIRGLRR